MDGGRSLLTRENRSNLARIARRLLLMQANLITKATGKNCCSGKRITPRSLREVKITKGMIGCGIFFLRQLTLTGDNKIKPRKSARADEQFPGTILSPD